MSVSNDRIARYTGERYGQRSDTRARYRDAVLACTSIEGLDKSVSDIARECGVDPESLRNHLKRHHPGVIPRREELRASLGYVRPGRYGLKPATEEKYSAAVAMLGDPAVTVREAAERCGVSPDGLQQHVALHHKELSAARLLYRVEALDAPKAVGERDCNNRLIGPSPALQERYSEALKLYRETDRPLTEIAQECGVDAAGFQGYVQKWERGAMESRQRRRSTERTLAIEGAAERLRSRPETPAASVARDFSIPLFTFLKTFPRLYPDLWARHREAIKAREGRDSRPGRAVSSLRPE